jgi:hypothetical protein
MTVALYPFLPVRRPMHHVPSPAVTREVLNTALASLGRPALGR